jgi:hypothetical protein
MRLKLVKPEKSPSIEYLNLRLGPLCFVCSAMVPKSEAFVVAISYERPV